MTAQRTYWHLQALGRKPSVYEIVTSRLLYHPQRGFEVRVPVADWYARYQAGSTLQCDDWEQFADPDATTYSRYVERQAARETYVDGVLRAHGAGGGDAALTPALRQRLVQATAPLRYPAHALQMAAAYLAQMAPSGRITVAATFQAADQMRCVQRLAYRLRLLQLADPGVADDGRAHWEREPVWQPLRETVERLLVAWDWGEAFVALNLCVKPAFDAFVYEQLGAAAREAGDGLLPQLLFSLAEDSAWQRAWSAALARVATDAREDNRAVLADARARWQPRALAAMTALAPLIDALAPGAGGDVKGAVAARCDALWMELRAAPQT